VPSTGRSPATTGGSSGRRAGLALRPVHARKPTRARCGRTAGSVPRPRKFAPAPPVRSRRHRRRYQRRDPQGERFAGGERAKPTRIESRKKDNATFRMESSRRRPNSKDRWRTKRSVYRPRGSHLDAVTGTEPVRACGVAQYPQSSGPIVLRNGAFRRVKMAGPCPLSRRHCGSFSEPSGAPEVSRQVPYSHAALLQCLWVLAPHIRRETRVIVYSHKGKLHPSLPSAAPKV
jgi:hypothetical protein